MRYEPRQVAMDYLLILQKGKGYITKYEMTSQ